MNFRMPSFAPPARITLLTALFLAVFLTACTGLLTSEEPPRQVYLLEPLPPAGDGASGPRDVTLLFRFGVVPGLDTDRILSLNPDARLLPYANARWPDHLPEVLNSVLQRSLDSSGRFRDIQNAGRNGTEEWTLDLELRAFYGLRDASGVTGSVRLVLAGTLGCEGRERPLYLSRDAPVREERLSAVVAAHQAALNDVSRELLEALDRNCAGENA